MEFWQTYGAVIMNLILFAIAVTGFSWDAGKRRKERAIELRAVVAEIVETNSQKAKLEKQKEAEEQRKICHTQLDRVINVEDRIEDLEMDIKGLKRVDRLNLECHDVILEVLTPQGNGRIKDMRAKLKEELYDGATR